MWLAGRDSTFLIELTHSWYSPELMINLCMGIVTSYRLKGSLIDSVELNW